MVNFYFYVYFKCLHQKSVTSRHVVKSDIRDRVLRSPWLGIETVWSFIAYALDGLGSLLLLRWFPFLKICILISSWLVSYLHLRLLVFCAYLPHLSLMVLKKFHISVSLPPFRIKFLWLLLIYIIVVIRFFHILPNFLPNYFTTSIIKHSFLSNSIHPFSVFVGLLFLRNSIACPMFAHVVLEVVFSNHPAVWTHSWWTHETLKHVGPLSTSLMHVFMYFDRKMLYRLKI